MDSEDWIMDCPHDDIKMYKATEWGKTIGVCQYCGKVFEYNPCEYEIDLYDNAEEYYKRPSKENQSKLLKLMGQEYVEETKIEIFKKLARELERRYFIKDCQLEFNKDDIILSLKGSLHVEVLRELKKICTVELSAIFEGEVVLKKYGNTFDDSKLQNNSVKKFIITYKDNENSQSNKKE